MRFSERLASVLLGREITPEGFIGTLDPDERILADARTRKGEVVLATDLGLWVGERRIPWHLVSKATWGNGALTVVEATESARHGPVVVLADAAPLRLPLPAPGKVPETVQRRVTGVITTRQHHDLPSGGAWFVQRRTPEGIEVHVRPDAGTDPDEVLTLAEGIAEKLRR
ncbi:hypothetical protein [Actinomycetospora corticicola]|uniref:Uncharacterized protein n=1 Tax=Actinomycetospora corticicola TaxID=663602 RepID=A0A7Y9DRZ4_9PSEU|nr:hypothetical protein [Actinomycetospora corticicola]